MCMEDVRLGRRSYPGQDIQSVTDTSAEAIQANDSRTALLVQNVGLNPVTLSPLNPAVASAGMVLAAGASLPLMDIQHHGALVTDGYFAVCGAGLTSTLVVWQSFLEER